MLVCASSATSKQIFSAIFWFLFFELLGSFRLLGKFSLVSIWGSPISKSLACLIISWNLGGGGGEGRSDGGLEFISRHLP